MSDAMDVICDIDQLRRDLSGYHGQLVAHQELKRHCENQRKMLAELQSAQKALKDENSKLRGLARDMYEAMWIVSATWAEDAYDERMRELGVGVDE